MFNKLKKRYLRFRAIHKLITQYEYVNEVNQVLEDYLTEKLLQGGSAEFMAKGRADLSAKQQELKTNLEFVEFLRKLKK